ncbi:MAG: GNAT family N-acetyltransferase [Ornithinibacter sp.]
MAERGGGACVVQVGPEDWRLYRDVRIASLIDSPRAFWATYAEASTRAEGEWRERLSTSPTWVALEGERPVGTVGLWQAPAQEPHEGLLVGMWVASVARGRGVADALVSAGLEHARALGWRRLSLDVAHENSRAWTFYLRFGFRPTGERGAMPWDPSVTEETLALDLSG